MLFHRCEIALALLSYLVLGGCSYSYRAGGGWGSGMSSVNGTVDGKKTHYSIARLALEKRPYLIVAIDRSDGCKVGGGGGSHQGHFSLSDGKTVEWSCATKDGKMGRVVIGNKYFELEKGGLFLVTTDKEVGVRQVAMPLDGIQQASPPRQFTEQAIADARIARFLESCRDE